MCKNIIFSDGKDIRGCVSPKALITNYFFGDLLSILVMKQHDIDSFSGRKWIIQIVNARLQLLGIIGDAASVHGINADVVKIGFLVLKFDLKFVAHGVGHVDKEVGLVVTNSHVGVNADLHNDGQVVGLVVKRVGDIGGHGIVCRGYDGTVIMVAILAQSIV